MMRSMFSGVSGLRSHQTMMDVVGNNIANVNTPGFKASVVTFAETISQLLRGPAGGQAERGGINPIQIGLGTRVIGIDGEFSQGASQVTNRNTDLAIQGSGFFMTELGDERYFTRNGSFSFDSIGNFVTPLGAMVQGWTADNTGEIDETADIGDIRLPLGTTVAPVITSEIELGGNLSADAVLDDEVTTSITIYDSLGQEHNVEVTFEKTANPREWDVEVTVSDGASVSLTPQTITFDTNGRIQAGTPDTLTMGFTPTGGGAAQSVDLILDGPNPLVFYGGQPSDAEAVSQDGQAKGDLRDFAISDDGSIFGQFSNGQSKLLGRVATASFNNPAGLQRMGDSTFIETPGSGQALVGRAGTGNRGLLSAGTLEMSNVDLAREFTNLIVAQRGFQANSRVITTTDEMLSELVNLKR